MGWQNAGALDVPAPLLLDAFIAGVYVAVGAFHLQVYLRRREMRTYLWLGLTCLFALLVDVTGTWERFNPDQQPPLSQRVPNNLGVGGASVCLLEFVGALVGARRSAIRRAVPPTILVLALAAAANAALMPALFTTVLALIAWAVGMLGSAARRGDAEARTVLGGFSVLAVALAVDIAMSQGLLPYVPGMPVVGFSTLFIAMAVSLSNRFERTHRELDALRQELELRVSDRTAALERANRRLRHYFPSRVVERILEARDEEKPRTERRVVTILFADLAGFTAYSDGADPDDVRRLVNEYVSAMFAEIDATGGTLDKVMGDGLMAFWGAPRAQPPEEQARSAVTTGAAMQRRLAALSDGWASRGLPTFLARVGLHQDTVAVGDIGTDELWSFTAIGSGVNLAQRLEAACEPGAVLVSGQVRQHLPDAWAPGAPRAVTLKGLRAPVDAFSVDVDAVAASGSAVTR